MDSKRLIWFECKIHAKSFTFLIIIALLTAFGFTQLREVFYMPVENDSDIKALNRCGEREFIFKANTDAALKEKTLSYLIKNISNGVIPPKKTNAFSPVLEMLEQEETTFVDILLVYQSDDYIHSWLLASQAQFSQCLGSVEEVNENLYNNLGKRGYSPTLQDKYVTYMQIMGALLLFPILVFVFTRDYRYHMYEIIYAQPALPSRYLLARFWGAFFPLSIFLYLLGLTLNLISFWKFAKGGYETVYTLFFPHFVMYLLPTVFFLTSLLMLLMLFMKRVVAVFPIYITYVILNVTPAVFNLKSDWIRMINPILRLDGKPLGTDAVLLNRICYGMLGILLLLISCWVYKSLRQDLKKEITI